MEITEIGSASRNIPEFLSGGGEMGQRIRDFDWSASPLGLVEFWPQSLRTCIRIMLTSRQPIWIGWGPQLIKLYNDPYKAIVGGKHPWALGQPASVVWKEISGTLQPLLKQVMEEDTGTYSESQLLIMERNGYPEETYYTFSYTPIPGDDGTTAGLICANTDDTERITNERQLKSLMQLGKSLKDARSNDDIIAQTIVALRDNPYDFPFALFYTIAENTATLAGATAAGKVTSNIPEKIDLKAPDQLSALLKEAVHSRTSQVCTDLVTKMGMMPTGAWEIPPDKAIILPIVQSGSMEAYGFLLVGLNPYRLLNEKYSAFFSLIADQVATSFTELHQLEQERKRVEALAEIDKAKTIFFSNISHEFRTPLTLLLSPIEDALNNANTLPENRVRIEVAYRNALRMQKLVNTLLDFSKIEAGRMEGKFTRVDVGSFTEDLASTFRSAIEKAGMELVIQREPVQAEVYVDIDMWEKIILNLVSNAFKYSKKGTIRIGVCQEGNEVKITVADTGVGIPADHLDKIFNRFHRVENTEGRSMEGTGIGLAMVKELVRLHNGTIEVTSELRNGSVFTVTIPTGKAHLPIDKIDEINTGVPTTTQSLAFVQEALKWLPSDIPSEMDEGHPEYKTTILLADDNADMRGYVQRLLSEQFHVITAVDGMDAYEKIVLNKPELVITDVMMPGLDGFGLLKNVRNHPELKNTPVIFLSARAGEESKVEGLDAGADDYLVKPFSARELIVRVTNHINTKKVHREIELKLEKLVAERTLELQRSNEDLQQFAHVASHDLKEPVRKIKTFSSRLQSEFAHSLPPKGKLYIDKIQSATDRMYDMIEGVLKYSTLNEEQLTVEMVDLDAVIQNIEADFELIIHQKQAVINKEKLPFIEGAPVLVYQLFYNLINNSLKFSRPEVAPVINITSSIESENGRERTKIVIVDNGIGFEQEHADRIFDTFTRLNSKDKYEGTGLGLALCKKIVEKHKGTIHATGNENEGAAFIILIPLIQTNKKV